MARTSTPEVTLEEKIMMRAFLTGTRAAVAIASALLSLMVLGGMALVSDHAVLIYQREVMAVAASTASLATAQQLATLPADMTDAEKAEELVPVARRYILANLPERYRPMAEETLEIDLTADTTTGLVDIVAKANLGGAIVGRYLWGDLISAAKAKKGSISNIKGVEVVLAIDVSTSMRRALDNRNASTDRPSRMSIVKDAARDLMTIIVPDETRKVAIGVIPWHHMVRLNDTAQGVWESSGWAEYPGTRRYAATYGCKRFPNCTADDTVQTLPVDHEAWQGCLDEHRVEAGKADQAPVKDLFVRPDRMAFAQAIFPALQGLSYECKQKPLPTDLQYQVCYGPEQPKISRVRGEIAAQRGCGAQDDKPETPSMLPLSTDATAVRAAIDALTAVGIRTHSTLGVAWGQRMLAEEWRDVWGDETHPLPVDATRKAIVLLTDGEDNPCGIGDPECTNNEVARARGAACTAVKAAGTEIFVIAAMHPDRVSGSLGASLTACSSAADNPDRAYVFLNNSSEADLRAAFTDIAKTLVTVRRAY